jgi:hypothetical protein
MKSGLGALERLRSSVRDGFGHTMVAYAVLAVSLLLTGLTTYRIWHNVEARRNARGSRRSPVPPNESRPGAWAPT